MISLASLEELGIRLGVTFDPESSDGKRAQAALDDASTLVRLEAGQDWLLEDSGDGDVLDPEMPEVISAITLAVAARGYRNPDGKTQTSVGDVSVSYSRQSGEGAIYLTKSEAKAIVKASGLGGSLTSVQVEVGYPGVSDPYWTPVEGGGDMIPIGPLPWENP